MAGSMLMSLFAGIHASGETLYDVYNYNRDWYYDIYAAQNITDDFSGVVAFEKGGVSYLLVRDQGDQGVVFNYTDISQLGSDVKYYNIEEHDQRQYTQTNWLLLHSGSLDLKPYAGMKIQKVMAEGNVNMNKPNNEGTCDEEAGGAHGKLGILTHRVDYITSGSESTTTAAINTYCPANFTGSDLVEGTDNGVTSQYFFMKPKQYEFAHIVNAQYVDDDAFIIPDKSTGLNEYGFKGGFKVQWDLYTGGKPNKDFLIAGRVYAFDAVIFYKPATPYGVWGIAPGQPWDCGCTCKLCNKYYEHHYTGDCDSGGWGWGAPKKTNTVHPHTHGVSVEAEASAVDENGISTEYIVYPVKINKDVIVTAVEEVSAAKQLAQVKYVNLQGQVSATPFAGVNIMVTTYTDGTSTSEKILK